MKHFRSPSNPWRKAAVGALALAVAGLMPAYQLAQASPPQGRPGESSNPPGPTSQVPGDKPWCWVPPLDRNQPDNLSCDFNQYDVRQALTKVLRRHGKSFRIDAQVKGIVTVALRNVTLATGLTNITRQVGASYTVERGVYMISNRPMAPAPAPVTPPAPVTFKDPQVTVEFEKADGREALRQLFRLSPRSYTISPLVQGTVTLSLKDVSFDDALGKVLRQIGGALEMKDGVYNIVPSPKPPVS